MTAVSERLGSTALLGHSASGLPPIHLFARPLARLVSGERAVSLPVLSGRQRRRLHAAARRTPLVEMPQHVGPAARSVHQGFQLAESVPSPLQSLAFGLGDRINGALTQLAVPCQRPFAFTEWRLQYYPPGGFGITPHRDHRAYRHLVAIVVLGGQGRFVVCEDRAGRQPKQVVAPPGWLILMRGHGFAGHGERPFHAVLDVHEPRWMLGLRSHAPTGASC